MKYEKLENLIRALFLIGAIAGGASAMSACTDEGPFEEAGEEIDEAAEEIDEEI